MAGIPWRCRQDQLQESFLSQGPGGDPETLASSTSFLREKTEVGIWGQLWPT